MIELISGIFWLLVMELGCTSAPRHEVTLYQLVPDSIRVRRPSGPGADPNAGPGGVDYQGQPLPNERLDCETMKWLFHELDLKAVQECFKSLSRPVDVLYTLRREAVPFFLLEQSETDPLCLRSSLEKIPVPREIIFQSNAVQTGMRGGEPLDCYAARLPIEADQWMGIRLPKSRATLKIHFPLSKAPESPDEIVRLLASWVLAPLWDDYTHALNSKIVPAHLCKQCIGEKEMYDTQRPPSVFWP